MRDELYINGKEIELSPGEPVGFTYQVYDIAQLEPQAAYSNSFNIINTNKNNVALNNSNTIPTNTLAPYRKLPCTFIRNGIPIISNGVAIIEGSQGFYNITIYSSIFDFFQQLGEKTLKDIDWSGYNHLYTLAEIKAINENFIARTTEICWPLIQWGAYKLDKNIDIKYQQPAILFSKIIDKIFEQTTYTKSGEIFGSGIYNDMWLTLSPDEYEVSESELLARSYKATINKNITDVGIQSDGDEARPIMFNLISYFADTTAPGFNTDSIYIDISPNHYFRVPSPASWAPLKILSNTSYRSTTYTTIEIRTKLTIKNKLLYNNDFEKYVIFKNNLTVYSVPFAPYTGQQESSTTIFQNIYTIDLKPGDEIKIQLRIGTLTEGAQHGFVINNKNLDDNYLNIQAISTQPFGSNLNYNQLIPEYSLKDILKSFCQQFGLIIKPENKNIKFAAFREIKQNISKSEDWSNKLDLISEPEISYRIGSYAQINKLKYKADQYTDGFGDSSFEINDQVLPVNVDLFELIYPSCLPELNIRTTDYKFVQLPLERYYTLPQWKPYVAHSTNDEVAYANVIYKAITNISIGDYGQLDNTGIWKISEDQYQLDQPNQGVKIDRYTLIEADDWDSETTYSTGDEAKRNNKIWVSNSDDNTGNIPSPESSYWALRILQYEQSITSASRLVLLRAMNPVNPQGYLFFNSVTMTDGVNTLSTITTNYPMAYFSDNSQIYNLTFQYFVQNYLKEFIQMMNQLKVVVALFNLNELDILQLDFMLLKYIDYFDNHFYLTTVQEYISGQSTKCQLIRM